MDLSHIHLAVLSKPRSSAFLPSRNRTTFLFNQSLYSSAVESCALIGCKKNSFSCTFVRLYHTGTFYAQIVQILS